MIQIDGFGQNGHSLAPHNLSHIVIIVISSSCFGSESRGFPRQNHEASRGLVYSLHRLYRAYMAGEGKQCSCCGLHKEGMVGSRCLPCNPLRLRIIRAKADMTEGETGSFDAMSSENSQAFFQYNAHLHKEELKTAMRVAIERQVASGTEVELVGNGDFLDEEDLKAKYAAKPGRADTIITNTKKIYCGAAEIYLYEDMHYKSKKREYSSIQRKVTATMDQESSRKAAKPKAKAKTTPKPTTGPGGDSNGLFEEDKAFTVKQLEDMSKFANPISEQAAILEKATKEDGICKAVLEATGESGKVVEFNAMFEVFKSTIELARETTKADFVKIRTEQKELLSCAKGLVKQISGFKASIPAVKAPAVEEAVKASKVRA